MEDSRFALGADVIVLSYVYATIRLTVIVISYRRTVGVIHW